MRHKVFSKERINEFLLEFCSTTEEMEFYAGLNTTAHAEEDGYIKLDTYNVWVYRDNPFFSDEDKEILESILFIEKNRTI